MTSYDASPASVRTLAQTFWSSAGWHATPQWPDPDRFRSAVDRGVMFDQPRVLTHDQWVAAARQAASKTDSGQAEEAFLASLSRRQRLDLRSALSSYVLASQLPDHPFTTRGMSVECAICGLYPDGEEDLNVLNFERFKWGGVRRDSVIYAAFDLEQFALAPRITPGAADLELGRQVIRTLRDLPSGVTASQAQRHLSFLPSNKAEREVIVDILGVCGILETPDHPGYSQSFVKYSDRELPPHHFVDRAYPVCWWRSDDGVSHSSLLRALPRLATG